MRPLPVVPQLEELARRVVWFKSPVEAISMPEHLIAHVLTYGTHEDVNVLRRFVSDDELIDALAAAHGLAGAALRAEVADRRVDGDVGRGRRVGGASDDGAAVAAPEHRRRKQRGEAQALSLESRHGDHLSHRPEYGRRRSVTVRLCFKRDADRHGLRRA